MDSIFFYYFLEFLHEDVDLDEKDDIPKCKRTIFDQSIFSRTSATNTSDPQPRILRTHNGLLRYYGVYELFSMSWIPTGDRILPTLSL